MPVSYRLKSTLHKTYYPHLSSTASVIHQTCILPLPLATACLNTTAAHLLLVAPPCSADAGKESLPSLGPKIANLGGMRDSRCVILCCVDAAGTVALSFNIMTHGMYQGDRLAWHGAFTDVMSQFCNVNASACIQQCRVLQPAQHAVMHGIHVSNRIAHVASAGAWQHCGTVCAVL